jgi:hypothetical protein
MENKTKYLKELVLVLLGFALVIIMVGLLNKSNNYRKQAEVFVTYEDTAVEFMTEDGNTWLVNVPSTEQYHVGDEVTLTFKNIGDDDNIYNDEVVEVGYEHR